MVLMHLEKKGKEPHGALGGAILDGVNAFELKTKNKRKTVVPNEVIENSTVRRRILRSDVAKQKEKEAEDAKKKYLEEMLDLDSGITEKKVIDGVIPFTQLKVESKRVLRSNGRKAGLHKSHAVKFSEEPVSIECQRNGIEDSTCEDDIEAQQDDITKSNFAKEGEKNGPKNKIAVDDVVISDEIVNEDGALRIDHDQSIFSTSNFDDAEKTSCEGGRLVEKKDDVSRDMEGSLTHTIKFGELFNSNKNQVTEEVTPGADKYIKGSNSAFSESNIIEKMNFDLANRVDCKTHMELDVVEQRKFEDAEKGLGMAEVVSGTGHDTKPAVRNRKTRASITVENGRRTRSQTAKLMEEAEGNTDKKRRTEKVYSEGDIGSQTGTEIEEMIVESDICKKYMTEEKTDAGMRRDMVSDVDKHWDKADNNKARKRSMDSGYETKRSSQLTDDIIDKKKIKTDLLSHKRDHTEVVQEKKKLMMGSSRSHSLGSRETDPDEIQKDSSYVKKIKTNLKRGSKLEGKLKGTKVKLSKHLGQTTLKELKQNGRRSSSFSKKSKVKGEGRDSSFLSTNKNMLESEKSHNQMGKISISKKQMSSDAVISAQPLPTLKESKIVDTSHDMNAVTFCKQKDTTQARKEKEAELRMARKKLRDQIKGMLLNAGWKTDLRPRTGKNYTDIVYMSPDGCTHWSIVKAYYAFEKEFSRGHDHNGKHFSGKPHKKSCKSSLPSFFPVSEEALTILKHPISRRRTRKELEEAGEGRVNKKWKKHNKCVEEKSSQKKGGMYKGRAKKSSSGAKRAFSFAGKKLHLRKYRKKQKKCALLIRSFNKDAETGADIYVPYAWKRTILSWMIDLGIINEHAAVKYMNRRRTKILLKGEITREGINCRCCSKIFTVSDFEIHAGSKQCDPYQNIFMEEDGTSLLQCQIYSWKKQDESERRGFYSIDTQGDDPNDDTCGICGDGGDLICCDGCPSAFHQSCLGTEMLPPGDWYCMNCSCRYCASNPGIIALENGEINSKLLSCSQCEEKYHQTCIPEEDAVIMGPSQSCSSFCGHACKKIFEKLRMLLGIKNYLDEGYSWTILQRLDDDLPETNCTFEQRAERNSKIAVALAVMDECFLPIIDRRSGINLIHNVVYNCGSNFNRLNYSGFYTFLLERDDEIISVASLRIHGTRAAEMPFIGTRNMYRRQGMCRRLLNEIELVLRSLNIEKLIIPSISKMKDTWTKVFGFRAPEISEEEEIRSINLLVFPGIGLLLKPLLRNDSGEHGKSADKVDLMFEIEIVQNHAPEVPNELAVSAIVSAEYHASDDVIVQHKLECHH